MTADIDALYRAGSRRVLATLIRLLGSFELAKEALHDAFAAAAEPELDPATIADDQLRLIFVCCHPALSPEARVALTLREVCALTTEEIARAFLTSGPALAQRIVRAKAKIRDAGIPYEVPDRPQLPERLAGVLQVVYLVFNEGYSASAGATVVRHELAAEAIRLGRLLIQLLPEPEAIGLLALMLLHDSRRHARASPDGDLVLLPEQDRTRWDHAQIAEGLVLAHRVMAVQPSAPYAIQAAIAAAHARAATAEMTDWAEIARLYDLLFAAVPSPIVALNRAVAVAMRDGPEAGLVLIDALLEGDELARYHLAHSARADLLRRLGRREAAKVAYERALALATQAPERRFLLKQMGRLVG